MLIFFTVAYAVRRDDEVNREKRFFFTVNIYPEFNLFQHGLHKQKAMSVTSSDPNVLMLQ